MIDFPHLIEPGVRATPKEVAENFQSIRAATQNIQPSWIEDSSIGFRHLDAPGWKTTTFFQDNASITHTDLGLSPHILPLPPMIGTATHIGGPVITVASLTATATGSGVNSALQVAIYVDGVKKVEADIQIREPGVIPVSLFYMFIATSSSHVIDVRSDNADTPPANITLSNRRMHTTAVRVAP